MCTCAPTSLKHAKLVPSRHAKIRFHLQVQAPLCKCGQVSIAKGSSQPRIVHAPTDLEPQAFHDAQELQREAVLSEIISALDIAGVMVCVNVHAFVYASSSSLGALCK